MTTYAIKYACTWEGKKPKKADFSHTYDHFDTLASAKKEFKKLVWGDDYPAAIFAIDKNGKETRVRA